MSEDNKAVIRRLVPEGDTVVGRFTCSATHRSGAVMPSSPATGPDPDRSRRSFPAFVEARSRPR
jgi:hypothetical protein